MKTRKTRLSTGSLAVLSAVNVSAQAQPAMDHSQVAGIQSAK